MMSFSRTEKNKLVLIIDVQSSIVCGTLAMYTAIERPIAIYTVSEDISSQVGSNSGELIKATIKTTAHVIGETIKYLHSAHGPVDMSGPGHISIPKKISSVHYVLSSPWILSEARTLSTTFDGQRKVTESMIRGMIDDDREEMIAKAGAKNKAVTVEEKILGIKLNGYPVSLWRGKDTGSLSVSFVTSISGAKMIDRLIEACDHLVRRHDIHFHSSLLLQHIGISRVFPDREAYTVVHIHGEITDLLVVNDGSCVFFGTYPIGTRSILRAIANSCGVESQTAASMVSLYNDGVIDHRLDNCREYIDRQSVRWLDQFEKLTSRIQTGPIAQGPFIISALERQVDFAKLLKGKFTKARVEILTAEEISGSVMFGQATHGSVMVGLYIVALRDGYHYMFRQ